MWFGPRHPRRPAVNPPGVSRLATTLPIALCCQIAVADFDGDGKADLAITNYASSDSDPGAVLILLGKGDGTFSAPKQFRAGLNPQFPAVADFNGDGKLDIAVADFGSGSVSLLLGNGDGTFGSPSGFSAGEDALGDPVAMIALDLNGDGAQDLVVANGGDKSVSVLLNSGGKFGQPILTHLPFSADYLAYSDFNHDGKLDLVVASENSNALMMLLGKGDGTFQAAASYATANYPASIAAVPLEDGSSLLFTGDRLNDDTLITPVTADGLVRLPPYHFTGAAQPALPRPT